MDDDERPELSLQERFAPHNRCFGCGPENAKGLRIRSFPTPSDDGELICDFTPQEHHEAFEGFVNGGIIGALLDCHSNWAAGWHLMRRDRLDQLPLTVTAEFHVKFRRPTPSDGPLRVSAKAVESDGKRVTVESTLRAGDRVTARCTGHFVAIGPDHPAIRHGDPRP